MKILYVVSNQSLAGYHGGTTHALAVTRELLRHHDEVHVVCRLNSAPVDFPAEAVLYPLKPRHPFLLWRSGSEIQKLLDQIKPDVVMERYYNFAGEAILRAHAAGIPTILEVNSPMVEYPGSWKSRLDLLLLGKLKQRRERIARSASLIVAPLKEIVSPEFHDRVRETEWGADTELFDPAMVPDKLLLRAEKGFDPDEVLFVHFGSLRKWHGLVTLLEAFDSARKRIQRACRLIIIGPSSHIKREQVSFVGTVPQPELPGWLRMCDCAVLPFSIEQHRYLEIGFFWSPLKVFEAMAMEMPLITLRHPRLTNLLQTEDPAFFYDGTAEDLAAKMVEMESHLEQHGEAAGQFRQTVLRDYSWRAHGEKLEGWIQEACVGQG
jgi:glycosyltransferase involved in cell wall biosynthesis